MTGMPPLSHLRRQLEQLRLRRRNTRWLTAGSAVLLALLWSLGGFYLLDVLLEMSVPGRLLCWAVVAGIAIWAARRFALPWLGSRETVIDMALMVEQQQQIDSDLVAALEFESPEAARWGSRQLQQAVVEYVAEFGRGLNVFAGLDRRPMFRRLNAALASLAVAVMVAAVVPGHTWAFLQRLFFSGVHYPTQTQIAEVAINGQAVELLPVSQVSATCPYGQPLQFRVTCEGVLPTAGRAELHTIGSAMETVVDLAKLETLDDGRVVFGGELPRMVDSLRCQFYLGDAWTDPAQLAVIPLPSVELQLTAYPPEYAHATLGDQVTAKGRQLAVLEGSRVELAVTCDNKPLREATLVIDQSEYPLAASDDGRRWELPAGDSPLGEVNTAIRFEVRATDQDGLSPRRPLTGFVRIKTDRLPQIRGTVVTRYVLPEARPVIDYRVSDDFGIAQVQLLAEVVSPHRPAGDMPETSARRQVTVDVLRPRSPLLSAELPREGEFELDLGQLDLVKGDSVRVTLLATDDRGRLEGRTAMSEAIVLDVTDEGGILSAMTELDEMSLRRFDEIIRRQLGVGKGSR